MACVYMCHGNGNTQSLGNSLALEVFQLLSSGALWLANPLQGIGQQAEHVVAALDMTS